MLFFFPLVLICDLNCDVFGRPASSLCQLCISVPTRDGKPRPCCRISPWGDQQGVRLAAADPRNRHNLQRSESPVILSHISSYSAVTECMDILRE